ncbi:MAG: hypothetical protein MK008_04340 [Bdellovibrionales bacterium]|nr:hypothetical protein [Bdellovibrionales bacterium]
MKKIIIFLGIFAIIIYIFILVNPSLKSKAQMYFIGGGVTGSIISGERKLCLLALETLEQNQDHDSYTSFFLNNLDIGIDSIDKTVKGPTLSMFLLDYTLESNMRPQDCFLSALKKLNYNKTEIVKKLLNSKNFYFFSDISMNFVEEFFNYSEETKQAILNIMAQDQNRSSAILSLVKRSQKLNLNDIAIQVLEKKLKTGIDVHNTVEFLMLKDEIKTNKIPTFFLDLLKNKDISTKSKQAIAKLLFFKYKNSKLLFPKIYPYIKGNLPPFYRNMPTSI